MIVFSLDSTWPAATSLTFTRPHQLPPTWRCWFGCSQAEGRRRRSVVPWLTVQGCLAALQVYFAVVSQTVIYAEDG